MVNAYQLDLWGVCVLFHLVSVAALHTNTPCLDLGTSLPLIGGNCLQHIKIGFCVYFERMWWAYPVTGVPQRFYKLWWEQ